MRNKQYITAVSLLLSILVSSACLTNYPVWCGSRTITDGTYSCTASASQFWQGLTASASSGGYNTSLSMITCQWSCTAIDNSGGKHHITDSQDEYYASVIDSSCPSGGSGGSGGGGSKT